MARRREGSDVEIDCPQILEITRLGHCRCDEQHILDELLSLELRGGRVLKRGFDKVKDDLLLCLVPLRPGEVGG